MSEIMKRTLTTGNDLSDIRVSAPSMEQLQKICQDGTPDWVSHPNDYRNMAEEEYFRELENSCDKVAEYRTMREEFLRDDSIRLINFMHARDFVNRLKEYGVECLLGWNGIPRQAALYAVSPRERRKGHQNICMVQIPWMPEWSTWNVEKHGILNGESSRGWRTVLYHLIRTRTITESQASEWFGEPGGPAAHLHRKDLYALRNN